jgi:hypothetical protein
VGQGTPPPASTATKSDRGGAPVAPRPALPPHLTTSTIVSPGHGPTGISSAGSGGGSSNTKDVSPRASPSLPLVTEDGEGEDDDTRSHGGASGSVTSVTNTLATATSGVAEGGEWWEQAAPRSRSSSGAAPRSTPTPTITPRFGAGTTRRLSLLQHRRSSLTTGPLPVKDGGSPTSGLQGAAGVGAPSGSGVDDDSPSPVSGAAPSGGLDTGDVPPSDGVVGTIATSDVLAVAGSGEEKDTPPRDSVHEAGVTALCSHHGAARVFGLVHRRLQRPSPRSQRFTPLENYIPVAPQALCRLQRWWQSRHHPCPWTCLMRSW